MAAPAKQAEVNRIAAAALATLGKPASLPEQWQQFAAASNGLRMADTGNRASYMTASSIG